MTNSRSHLALPVTIAVTCVVALLPAGWPGGWTTEASEIVQFPLIPFADAGNAVGGWLRPPRPLSDGLGSGAADVDKLIEDRDLAQRLYHREQQRANELEDMLRQLQKLPPETLRYASTSLIAHVVSRAPDSPLGVVQVRLERGVATEVRPNTVAVYAGGYILGRTVGEGSARLCSVLPIANRATGYIRGRVYPADDPLGAGIGIQLEPTGSGGFVAEIEASHAIGEGDRVRLSDPGWPRTAQGMVIGEIESMAVDDDEPLRNRIDVRPIYQVQQVAYVTLIVEERVGGDGAGGS